MFESQICVNFIFIEKKCHNRGYSNDYKAQKDKIGGIISLLHYILKSNSLILYKNLESAANQVILL